jgi:Fe-S oxidoreductase
MSGSRPLIDRDLDARMSRCTHCAACRSGCPTFDATLLEGHSGRGRVILARGLLQHELRLDARAQEYLLACTRCAWCETVCPVDIPVVELIETALATFTSVTPRDPPDVTDLEARAGALLESGGGPWPPELAGPVVVHWPCSDRWHGRKNARLHALLKERGADLLEVPQPHCCGGATPASERAPDLARELGLSWIEELKSRGVRVLISNDPGCRAHFRNLGFETDGRRILSAAEALAVLQS